MRQALDLYKSYGIYTNTQKMLPSIVDGLLPVHRRILLVLHNIASKNKVKTVTANGELLGKYHPHAESTGPCVWAVKNEFAIGYGQWGSDLGIESIEPAAARYTEVKASPYIEQTAMKLIKYVNWELNELDYEEPKHIPTLFPFVLMGKKELSQMGFGVKPEFPIYTKKDLCKRLLFLLGKTSSESVIKPFIPNCDILSGRKDLKALLTTGEATIKIKGNYIEDKRNNCIYITGWNPRTKFEVIYKSILRYKKIDLTDSIGMLDESNEQNGTKIRFEVLKQRNTKDIYEHMKAAIDSALESNIRYSMYVYDENKFKLSSVDEMLMRCYDFYKQTYDTYCTYNINRLNDQLKEYQIIEKIKPHISTITISKTVDIEKSIKRLSSWSNVNEEDTKSVIEKYNIKKLLSFKTDQSEIKEKIDDFTNKLNNLENSVLQEYKNAIS